MQSNHKDLLKLVNSSGFPFQLLIEREIKRKQKNRDYRWNCIREHHWIDPESNEEGFIDLVLIGKNPNQHNRIVIECKRSQNAQWIFLINEDATDKKQPTSNYRAHWTCQSPAGTFLSGWDDFSVEPHSPVSSFCVVRSQDDNKPMLENLSSKLLKALESLAQEELDVFSPSKTKITGRVYYPVIVTNAKLAICYFSPKLVDIETGKIDPQQISWSNFREVPMVRFQKNLYTRAKSLINKASDLTQLNEKNERTVLVVNSSHLIHDLIDTWEEIVGDPRCNDKFEQLLT